MLRAHVSICSKTEYTCHKCNKSFRERSDLDKHLKTCVQTFEISSVVKYEELSNEDSMISTKDQFSYHDFLKVQIDSILFEIKDKVLD